MEMCELIANDILNIVNLMQTFEYLLPQSYSTVFLDIAGACPGFLKGRVQYLLVP